jgi:hypothetical protein
LVERLARFTDGRTARHARAAYVAGSLLYPQQQNCGTRDWLKACPRVRRTRLMANDAAMMALVA